jgi:hypothetical protein
MPKTNYPGNDPDDLLPDLDPVQELILIDELFAEFGDSLNDSMTGIIGSHQDKTKAAAELKKDAIWLNARLLEYETSLSKSGYLAYQLVLEFMLPGSREQLTGWGHFQRIQKYRDHLLHHASLARKDLQDFF